MTDRYSFSREDGPSTGDERTSRSVSRPSEETEVCRAPGVRVYDSRGERVLTTDADAPEHSRMAESLFGYNAPLGYDGEAVYVAIRVRDSSRRAQTCFGRMDAEGLRSLSELSGELRTVFRDTDLDLVEPDPGDLAAISGSLDADHRAAIPSAVEGLIEAGGDVRVGVPDFETALGVAGTCFRLERPVAITTNDRYVEGDHDRRSIDFADVVVAVDDRYDAVTPSRATRERAESHERRHRERKLEDLFSEVGDLLERANGMGLGREEAESRLSECLDDVYRTRETARRRQNGGGRRADGQFGRTGRTRPGASGASGGRTGTATSGGGRPTGDSGASAGSDLSRTYSDSSRSSSGYRIDVAVLLTVLLAAGVVAWGLSGFPLPSVDLTVPAAPAVVHENPLLTVGVTVAFILVALLGMVGIVLWQSRQR